MNKKILNAICNNDLDFLIKHVKKKNIDKILKEEDNETFLSYSLSDSKSKMFDFFINNGANLNLKNKFGETILHSAIYSDDLERVKKIIKLNPELLNVPSSDLTTPLLLSLCLSNQEIAKFLINSGANFNICNNEGLYPIHVACQDGFTEIVKILIDKDVNLNVKTKKGNLPISLAANNSHLDIVKIIFNKYYAQKKLTN